MRSKNQMIAVQGLSSSFLVNVAGLGAAGNVWTGYLDDRNRMIRSYRIYILLEVAMRMTIYKRLIKVEHLGGLAHFRKRNNKIS